MLLSCTFRDPVPAVDSGGGGADTGGGAAWAALSEPGQVLVLTANEVLSAGWLATIRMEDGARSDELVPTGGDAVMRRAGDALLLLDRSEGGALRVLDPSDWTAAGLEIALDGGPYDAARCGDAIFVSRYEAGEVAAFDAESGAPLGTVSTGGSPAGLVADGETLYVAIHRVDEELWVALDGAVGAIDCASLSLEETWELDGTLPAIQSWPGTAGVLLVQLDVDSRGVVRGFDTATGALSSVMDLASESVRDYALSEDEGVFLTRDEGGASQVWCYRYGGGEGDAVPAGQRYASQLADVDLSAEGRAWIAARPAWDDPGGAAGLLVYDLASCGPLNAEALLQTTEPPLQVLIAPDW